MQWLMRQMGIVTLYAMRKATRRSQAHPRTAYLASASVVGLAIGFGSQGIVPDVVTGLTLIYSNTG